MIYTNVTVKIHNNGTASANTRVLLYRGDREVEIQFSLVGNPFVVERSAFAQLIITRTKGGPIFTNISAVKDSKVILTITEDNIDEMTEIGFYNFQIRLFDDDMSARVTLPPIENGLEVREPIADDNAATIGYAMINYSRLARAEILDEPTFDEYDEYNRTFWQDGDYITDVKMNKIEDAIYTINQRSLSNVSAAYISSSMNEEQKVNIGEDFVVTFDFVSPNLGRGTLKVNVNNTPKMTMYVEQEETTVAISHEYLTTGNNKVTLYVVDRAGKMSNELTFTVRYGSASIVSDFDSNTAYQQGSVVRYYFTPSALDTSLDLTFYMVVDGVLQGTTTCTADKRGYYTFPTNMTAGGYRCQAYIIDGEGNKSNILEFNLVIINETSLVVVSNTVDPSVEEGNQLALDFKVYMQGATSFITKVYVDNNLVSTGTCGLDTAYYRTSSLKEGSHTVRLDVYDIAEKVSDSITWNVTVTPSTFAKITPVTTGALFIASAVDRSNSDENRNLLIGTDQDGDNISAQLTNFSFDSESGWIDNELIFSGASTLTIPIAPLANNARYGFTLDMEFTSKAIGVDDALVLKLWDDTKNCGIKITTENLILRSAEGNECNLYFEDNANTSVMFIIDRNEGKAKIYLNGVMCSAFQLSDYTANGETFLEDFSTNSNVVLGGSGYCKLRNIRIYQVALTTDEILNNFIANKNSTGEQKALMEFQKGNTLPTMTIYCDFSGLGKDDKKPCKIVYVSTDEEKYGQSFTLEHKQSTLQYQGTSSMAYPIKNYRINLADESGNKWRYNFPKGKPEWRYTLKADFMSSGHWQNTGLTKWINDNLYNYNESDEKSMNPKKWFDIHNGGSLQDTRECIYGFPCRLILINDGTTALNEGQNEPSPGNTKDMGIFNFNHDKDDTDTMGFDSDNFPNCMSFEIAANSDTSSGAFISYTPNDEQTELEYLQESFEMRYPDPDDYDPWHGYLGLKSDRILVDYNKTDEGYRTVGFDFITSKSSAEVSSDVPIVSLECMDGEESLMKVAVGAVEGTPMVIGGTNRVRFIFEEKPNEITIDGAHYYIGELTDVEYKNPYQEEGIMADYGLKRVIDWVDKCSDEEFVRDFDLYFHRDYTLRYYLLVIALGMIDNLGKNMMFDTWDCKIWMPRFYDCDTICSYSNDGTIKFDVDIEMEQGYWNTSSSRLWTRIRDLMHNELVAKYAVMRANGLTYESLMQCFYDEQIAKIPQAYYNMDADVKYLPFGDEYLGKAHGDGYEHLKRWLKNRLIFTDTLFDYSPSYENDILTIRANTTELMNLQIETYTPVYQHLSWFNGQMDNVKINRGEKVNFSGRAAAATDQEILIYGGSNVKKISGITSTNPSAMLLGGATRLTELIAPDCPILVDINANKANLAPHTYLNKVDLSGCTQLGGNLRLNNSPLIRDIDMTDTVITGVNLPPSAKNLETLKIPETVKELSIKSAMILRNLELPSTIEYLSLIDTPQLQTITVTTCDNLKTLIMEKPASNPFIMIGKASNLEYVRLIDIKAQTTTEAVQKLLKVKGLDAAGNVVDAGQAVSGTITLTTCSASLEAELKAAYPNVTFIVQTYIQSFTVKFVDGDGNELYKTEALSNGEVVYVGPTPTKTMDAQYTYEWTGWNIPLKPVIGNMTIKAEFKSILRYYDIYFYDGNTMEVVSHQYLGYGSSPTVPSFPDGLNMWSPSVGKVIGPAQYTAKYAPYPEDLSIFSFASYNDTTIDNTSYNAMCVGMSTSKSMPTAVIFPFEYNNKPVTKILASSVSSSNSKYRTSVTNAYIPETIHSICDYAFHRCTNLKELNIPSSVRQILGTQVFGYSGITNIIAPGCKKFGNDKSDYGPCYNMTSLEYVILGSKEYPFEEIRCYGTSSNYGLFNASNKLKFVNLVTKNGLRSDVKFSGYEANNTSVNYIFTKEPVRVENINGVNYVLMDGEWAVLGLADTTLTSITIPDTIDGYPVTIIDKKAFYGVKTLTAVRGCANIREIRESAFDCYSSKDTELTQLGDVENEINLPNLEILGPYALRYRTKLGANGLKCPKLKIIDTYALYYTNTAAFDCPLLTTIKAYGVGYCKSLTRLTDEECPSLSVVGVGAFYDCSNLQEIILPKVQRVEESVFTSVKASIIIIGSEEYPVTYYALSTTASSGIPFYTSNYTKACCLVTDAEYLEDLYPDFESGTTHYYAYSSTYMGGTVYEKNEVSGICLFHKNVEQTTRDGYTLLGNDEDGYILYDFTDDFTYSGNTIKIPDYIRRIGPSVIPESVKATSYDIPDSVTVIEYSAFYNAYPNLEKIIGAKNVTVIGRNAFYSCTRLKGHIDFPSIVAIEYEAFRNCAKITSFTGKPRYIEPSVFNGCTQLTSIDTSECVYLGSEAFYNCSNIKFMYLPKVQVLFKGTFYYCYNLLSVVVGSAERPLKSVYLYSSSSSTQSMTFGSCTRLNKIYITTEHGASSDLSNINNSGSYFGTNTDGNITLTSSCVVYSASDQAYAKTENDVDYIVMSDTDECYAVNYDRSKTSIRFADAIDGKPVSDIYFLFRDNTVIESVHLPSSLTMLDTYMFQDCEKLKTVTGCENITTIATYVFNRCKSLTGVNFPNATKCNISSFAFCDSLKYAILPKVENYSGSNGLPSYIFQECTSLEYVLLSSITNISGTQAFEGCKSLVLVVFGSTNTPVTKYAPRYNTADSELTFRNIGAKTNIVAVTENGLVSDLSSTTSYGSSYPIGSVAGGSSLYSYNDDIQCVSDDFDEIVDTDDYIYAKGDGGLFLAKIKNPDPDVTELVLPSKIDNLDVTHLGKGLFTYNTTITSINMPDSVKYIGPDCFRDTINVTTISGGRNVEVLKYQAFGTQSYSASESKLRTWGDEQGTLSLPKLRQISRYALGMMYYFKIIKFPKIEALHSYSLGSSHSYRNIYLGGSLNYIEKNAASNISFELIEIGGPGDPCTGDTNWSSYWLQSSSGYGPQINIYTADGTNAGFTKSPWGAASSIPIAYIKA